MKKIIYCLLLLVVFNTGYSLSVHASPIANPTVPENILTTANDNRIVISWDESANAESYEIEVDGIIINNSHYTIYEHDHVLPLTTHTYRVRAKNSLGISEWSTAITQKTSNPKLKELNTIRVGREIIQPRLGFKAVTVNNKIYILGGYGRGYINTIEAYDPLSDNWEIVTTMPTARLQPAVVVGGSKIYIIGGYNQEEHTLNSVDVYDTANDSWESMESMPTKRSGATSVIHQNEIYVIGGYNQDKQSMNVVEVYNIQQKTWTTIKPMPTKRSQMASVVYNNKIYVMGGYNGFVIGDIETYDLATKEWTKKGQMPIGRYGLEAMVANNKIMLVGGYNTLAFDTIECYTPEDNRFISQDHLRKGRYTLGASIINGELYIIGGSDEALALNSVEKAYLEKDEAPTNLSMEESNNAIVITWDKLSDDTIYELEVNGRAIKNGFKNTYTLSNIKLNKKYFVRVRGITKKGVTKWSDYRTHIKYASTPSAYAYIGERVRDVDNYETMDLYIMTKHIEDIYTVEVEAQYDSRDIQIIREEITPLIFSVEDATYQYMNLDKDGRIYINLSLTGDRVQLTDLINVYKIKLRLRTLDSTKIDIRKINVVNSTGHIIDIADIYDLDMPTLY